MQTWQMQEAKARLSEVLKRAELDGPQDITVCVFQRSWTPVSV